MRPAPIYHFDVEDEHGIGLEYVSQTAFELAEHEMNGAGIDVSDVMIELVSGPDFDGQTTIYSFEVYWKN